MSIEPGAAFRRIVTGHDAHNLAIIEADASPERIFDTLGEEGLVFYEVWNTRETPARIARSGGEPAEDRLTLAPPANGTRIRALDIPPDRPDTNFDTVFESIGGTGAHARGGGRHAAFHRTRSIDYGIILSGEITMLVDEGEVTVRAGDMVVQRGTNHAWVNRSGKACRIAFVLIDGAFDDGLA